MSEILLGLVVLSAVGGSILNTIRGWNNAADNTSYDLKKALGAIIPAIFAGIVVGQNLFASLPGDVTVLWACLTAGTLGFGLDYAVTKAKT